MDGADDNNNDAGYVNDDGSVDSKFDNVSVMAKTKLIALKI